MDSVVVQDNSREILLREMFGLVSPDDNREGIDAVDIMGNPFELKSTTKKSVSTARDVGQRHILKWRRKYWICAKGVNLKRGFRIDETYLLHPSQLNAWFSKLERDIDADEKFIEYLSTKLESTGIVYDDLERFRKIARRGITRNDPNISWNYIQQNGDLVVGCPKTFLMNWVKTHPLTRIEPMPSDNNLIKLVCSEEGW